MKQRTDQAPIHLYYLKNKKFHVKVKFFRRNVSVFLILFKTTNLQGMMEFQLNSIKNSGL